MDIGFKVKQVAHLNKLVWDRDVSSGGGGCVRLLQGGAWLLAKAAEHLLRDIADGVLHGLCPHMCCAHFHSWRCCNDLHPRHTVHLLQRAAWKNVCYHNVWCSS